MSGRIRNTMEIISQKCRKMIPLQIQTTVIEHFESATVVFARKSRRTHLTVQVTV